MPQPSMDLGIPKKEKALISVVLREPPYSFTISLISLDRERKRDAPRSHCSSCYRSRSRCSHARRTRCSC